jgi:starch synthase (maltosyl-transferring)
MGALGLEPGQTFEAHDLVTDEHWVWQRDNYVRLGPEVEPVHVVHVRRPW